MSNIIRVCNNCGSRNPFAAGRCNSCGLKFDKHGRDYYAMWECPKCGNYNMDENPYCECGKKAPSGPCFISTITCDLIGKPDNCIELETLRSFRANYLEKNVEGVEILRHYIDYSGFIVPELLNDSQNKVVANKLFANYIVPVLEQINFGNNNNAISKYKDMVFFLLDRYNYDKKG